MKLFIRKAMMFFFVTVIIALYTYPVMATDVGGQILTDTTWDLARSPYNIITDVQVAEGVTLTVESGVVINNGTIRVWGNFTAIGTNSLKVIFNSVAVVTEQAAISSIVNIKFSEFYGGSITHDDGNMLIEDSTINNLGSFYMFYPLGAYITRNIFVDSAGINTVQRDDVKVYIKNNVFYQQTTEYAIFNQANYNTSETIVEYNSFLSTDRIALRLSNSQPSDADITALNNFWNTTDTDIIDDMIYDRKDDFGIAEFIVYEPFLTEPHEDTPPLDFNQAPIAEAGDDKVVYDWVSLNGSASYDPDTPDGWIESYDWNLQHREDSAHNRTANGVNPTIFDLHPGFYDVNLIVTDNEAAVGTDALVLAVAGSGSFPQPNGDLLIERFKLSQSKKTDVTTTTFTGDVSLPSLNLSETVQLRLTIELFDALSGGGDCVLTDEAVLNVTDRKNRLVIRK